MCTDVSTVLASSSPGDRMPNPRTALVAALRRKLERHEGFRLPRDAQPLSTGVAPLDRLLPCQGLRPGSLAEYLTPTEGQGAGSLALLAARGACSDGRALVVLDRQRQFYLLAAAGWGIDLARTLLLRPANKADELWALDQALRCRGVGAVWARCEQLPVRDFRRLQLAAESGGTLGLLVRPVRQRGCPTWAEVQWRIEAQPSRDSWRLLVELVRAPAGSVGQSVQLEWDEAASAWCEVRPIHATQGKRRICR
jgi:protein ImuA